MLKVDTSSLITYFFPVNLLYIIILLLFKILSCLKIFLYFKELYKDKTGCMSLNFFVMDLCLTMISSNSMFLIGGSKQQVWLEQYLVYFKHFTLLYKKIAKDQYKKLFKLFLLVKFLLFFKSFKLLKLFKLIKLFKLLKLL